MAIESIRNNVQAANYAKTEVATPVAKADFSTSQSTPVVEQTATEQYGNEESKGNRPSENTVKQAISDINKKINPNTIAQYGFHDETNRVTIKIVDKDTDKTIKEFPAEETLDMIAKVWELAGMFLDERG